MIRCKACNKLNGDHQKTCSYCQAELEEKKSIKPIEPKDVTLSPIIPGLIIIYGVVIELIALFRLQTFQFEPLIYIMMGYALLRLIKKMDDVESRYKTLEKDYDRLKKDINILNQNQVDDQ